MLDNLLPELVQLRLHAAQIVDLGAQGRNVANFALQLAILLCEWHAVRCV